MDSDLVAVVERLRPAVEADGGALELRSVDRDEGVVRIALTGSCAGCGTSTATLQAGMLRIVRDHLGWVRELINVADPGEVSETPVAL